MNNSSAPTSERQGRYTYLYVFSLVLLLSVLALQPHMMSEFQLTLIPAVNNAQGIALFFAIISVAGMGAAVLVLTSRLRKLEVARDAQGHAALHDALTGAANRRHFEIFLDKLINDASPSHALLMIDLDRFKPINDLYGHAAGDALLKEITVGFKRLVQPADLVARLGGDEFAILLTNRSNASIEKSAIDVLQFVASYRLNWENERLSVGTSIGLVNINRKGLSTKDLLAASDEALYAAKEAGRGAIYCAERSNAENPTTTFRRINEPAAQTVSSARSHEPVDGRRQELQGLLMASQSSADNTDRRRVHGARRRHEVKHWVRIEPTTVGDAVSPGMSMRELLSDAASKGDGGADFARWVMAMALDSASRLTPAALGRINFVLPLPARALVTVPGLADELMRSNALAHLPIRHLTFILHGVTSVYDSTILKQVCQRLANSDIKLGFEIRADNIEVLAPLRHIAFNELHLGREVIKKLRPGSTDNATLDALLAVVERTETTLVAPNIDTPDEMKLLINKGIKRFAGPVVGTPEPLHNILQRLATEEAHLH